MSIDIYVDIESKGEIQLLTEQDQSEAVGESRSFFTSMRRHSPQNFKAIEELGGGSLVMGFIKFRLVVNQMLYYFGELYNLLEEEKYDFKKDSLVKRKGKTFGNLKALAFSSREASLSKETFLQLVEFCAHMLDLVEEKGLLEKYDLTKEDYEFINPWSENNDQKRN